MTNDREDLIKLLIDDGWVRYMASQIADVVFINYAIVRLDQMPVLNENGEASIDWRMELRATLGSDHDRVMAEFHLARAEWFDAKETRDAEAKLSERRNKVLAEYRERIGYPMNNPYENSPSNTRVLVDMIIEAEDKETPCTS